MTTHPGSPSSRLPTLAALALVVLTLAPALAAAADRVYWSGRSPEGHRYTYSNTYGTHWNSTVKLPGETLPGSYTEVTRTEDFIELELDGTGLRDRLYKDQLMSLSESSGRWGELAKGQWVH
ncbi:MAG: hypothetical protein JO112_12765 [Planctomycetes bacterium]|nr:hypothetical protein [Planctomycetota bacterium]